MQEIRRDRSRPTRSRLRPMVDASRSHPRYGPVSGRVDAVRTASLEAARSSLRR